MSVHIGQVRSEVEVTGGNAAPAPGSAHAAAPVDDEATNSRIRRITESMHLRSRRLYPERFDA